MTDRFFRLSLTVLLASACVLVWMGRYSNLDLWLSDWMFDPAQRDFPWRTRWFAAVFIHDWMKIFFILLGMALVLMAGFAWKLDVSRALRIRLAIVAGSALIIPSSVAILKRVSAQNCPWDIQRYGGMSPYLRLFDSLSQNIAAGHCFPAGHASGALWLAALSVFWLPEKPRTAGAVFLVGLIPGFVMGWVQQLRGAHFLSHTLWSVWITALVIVLMTRFLFSIEQQDQRERQPIVGKHGTA